MFGVPFAEKVREQVQLLRSAGVTQPSVAVDLGCGPGFQTAALVQLGARTVYALDTSRTLLEELAQRVEAPGVRACCRDLLAFAEVVPDRIDTIVCMGDTLTHLSRRQDVARLFAQVAGALHADGRCVISFRDLSTTPTGTERFIPLRSTKDKIMTCFLERAGDVVIVHDLIHVRTSESWTLHKSAYPKLILPVDEIRDDARANGLRVDWEYQERGMTTMALVRE